MNRTHTIRLNRAITLVSVFGALLTYLMRPLGVAMWALDIVVRAYLHFVAGVMAHEGVHGHLGETRSANSWWGRFAMLPTTVPYATFCATHRQHHRSTNIPRLDPDEFLNTPHKWQIPFRAFALPYHWLLSMFWDHSLTRRVRIECYIHYSAVGLIYGALGWLVGFERVVIGLLCSSTLHSLLLWYAFAIKTHEGYSTGSAETRSHNYRGKWVYWFSLGLSMHQLHHMTPKLAWIAMAPHVKTGNSLSSAL